MTLTYLDCRQAIRQCWRVAMLIGCLALAAGCAVGVQTRYKVDSDTFGLGPNDLEQYGIGFLTPAAATGREADKQSLAHSFAEQLRAERPAVRVVPLPVILSAVNAADLDQQYKRMYRDYLETGILDGAVLRLVGAEGDVRYLAQLSLADFQQQSRGRFSLLGLRLFDTKQSNMRVFMQVWDSSAGAVAWEGSIEVNRAYDTAAEKPSPFLEAAEIAARRLYQELPAPARAD
ncbi:MAG: hypothetical protein L6Q83_09335 [Gammaproteobacteria bacterium]|nr:hypothetical protein [Gammaproteobacteria bacterium]